MSSIGNGKNSSPTPPALSENVLEKDFFQTNFPGRITEHCALVLSLFEEFKSKSKHFKFPFPIVLQDDQRFLLPNEQLGIILAHKKIQS